MICIIIKNIKHVKHVSEELISFLDYNGVILLYGDLGSGKTTISRFIIQHINPLIKCVQSPTFTVINEYTSENIAHIDLYLLKSVNQFYNYGILDVIDNMKLSIIEWPNKFENELKDHWNVKVYIDLIQNNKRVLNIYFKNKSLENLFIQKMNKIK